MDVRSEVFVAGKVDRSDEAQTGSRWWWVLTALYAREIDSCVAQNFGRRYQKRTLKRCLLVNQLEQSLQKIIVSPHVRMDREEREGHLSFSMMIMLQLQLIGFISLDLFPSLHVIVDIFGGSHAHLTLCFLSSTTILIETWVWFSPRFQIRLSGQ